MKKDLLPNLAAYVELLRRADSLARQSRSTVRHRRCALGIRVRAVEADSLYDQALELLSEMVEHDPSIATWFDRSLRFDQDCEMSADSDGVPRLRWSRSRYRRGPLMPA